MTNFIALLSQHICRRESVFLRQYPPSDLFSDFDHFSRTGPITTLFEDFNLKTSLLSGDFLEEFWGEARRDRTLG